VIAFRAAFDLYLIELQPAQQMVRKLTAGARKIVPRCGVATQHVSYPDVRAKQQ
jgi:hypothetical protein